MSKYKFYKKYGKTPDSAENKVESSVFQSRNLHKKDHLHHLYAREVRKAKRNNVFSNSSMCAKINYLEKNWRI
jgi:hypothetical protein